MKYEKKKNIIIVAMVVLLGFLAGSLSKSGKEIIKYFVKDSPVYLVERVVDGDTFIISKELGVKSREGDRLSANILPLVENSTRVFRLSPLVRGEVG